MKHGLLGISMVALWVGTAFPSEASEGRYRAFTALDGRTIKAKVIKWDSTKNKVFIERDNRKKMWVACSIFSEADQEYIKGWIVTDSFLSTTQFRISVNKEKSRSQIYYEVIFDNRTGIPFENVRADYCIYIEGNGSNGGRDTKRSITGQIDLVMGAKEKSINKTTAVHLNTNYKSVWEPSWNGGGTTVQVKILEERLKGVWLKIYGSYLDGTPVVRELCLPSDLSKKVSWRAASPPRKLARRSSSRKAEPVGGRAAKALIDEGNRHMTGNGVEENHAKALGYYKKSYEQEPSATAANRICHLYLLSPQLRDFTLAEEWAQKAAKAGSCTGYNTMAWVFATGESGIRNGKEAVRLALISIKIHRETDALLDTLACAYARNGQFDLAVATQDKACKMAPNNSRKGYEDKLALFKQGKAYPPD